MSAITKNKISVTVLSDNRGAYGLETEHGFSLWIEMGDHHVLFDTGCGPAMLRNVEALGVDLTLADLVVLSHGHYDHTGNLPTVLKGSPHASLFLHHAALMERYSIHQLPRHVGMPNASVAAVKALPESRRHWIEAPFELTQRIWLTGPVPRVTSFEDTGGPFFKDAEGCQTDSIPDDQTLWIKTDRGLVVCLGCCHAGVINTLKLITRLAGEERIHAVLGGMHLLHANAERLRQTVDMLADYEIPHIYPCHCTGDAAIEFLQTQLGDTVSPGYAGMKLSF